MNKIHFKFVIEFQIDNKIFAKHRQHIINSIHTAISPMFEMEVSESSLSAADGFPLSAGCFLLTVIVTGEVNHLRSVAAYSQILQGVATLMLNLSDVFSYNFFIIDC